jgi:hypothetical protein
MSKPRKVYWDTTCFICFLNRNEDVRRKICEDVLVHAERGEIEIWHPIRLKRSRECSSTRGYTRSLLMSVSVQKRSNCAAPCQ